MPRTAALVEALRAHGVPAVVCGAGPTVLALPGRRRPELARAAWLVDRALAVEPGGAELRTSAGPALAAEHAVRVVVAAAALSV